MGGDIGDIPRSSPDVSQFDIPESVVNIIEDWIRKCAASRALSSGGCRLSHIIDSTYLVSDARKLEGMRQTNLCATRA